MYKYKRKIKRKEIIINLPTNLEKENIKVSSHWAKKFKQIWCHQ